jgi:N-acetylglutamate synthase/N-acetylornithine aminotransferase
VTFPADLKTHLAADATLTGLIGERLWPNKRFSETLPAATYQQLPAIAIAHNSGGDGKTRNIRLQVNTWAITHAEAHQVASAILTRMLTAAATFSAIGRTFEDVYEEDTKLHGVLLEFSVWYQET